MHFGGILPQSKEDDHDLNNGNVGVMVGIVVIIVLVIKNLWLNYKVMVIKNVVVMMMMMLWR